MPTLGSPISGDGSFCDGEIAKQVYYLVDYISNGELKYKTVHTFAESFAIKIIYRL